MPIPQPVLVALILLVTAISSESGETTLNQSDIHLLCGPTELQRHFDDFPTSTANGLAKGHQPEEAGITVSLQFIDEFHPSEDGSDLMKSLVSDHHAKIIFDTRFFEESMNHVLPRCEPHTVSKGGSTILVTYIVSRDSSGLVSQDCLKKIESSLISLHSFSPPFPASRPELVMHDQHLPNRRARGELVKAFVQMLQPDLA